MSTSATLVLPKVTQGMKRISGITDSGFGYQLDVKQTCKFDNLTQTCCGNCNGSSEDCTLKRIRSFDTIQKLLKPLKIKLDFDEIFEDNYAMHLMNSFEMQEKLKEKEQTERDEELNGNLTFHNWDTLRRREFYNDVRKRNKDMRDAQVNESIRRQQQQDIVKNILIDTELYEGNI